MRDPAGVARVYARLGFAPSAELDRALAVQERRSGARESGHDYSLEEFGLRRDEIRAALADLYETFGWDAGDKADDRHTGKGTGA